VVVYRGDVLTVKAIKGARAQVEFRSKDPNHPPGTVVTGWVNSTILFRLEKPPGKP
jgi:hypothetical protein